MEEKQKCCICETLEDMDYPGYIHTKVGIFCGHHWLSHYWSTLSEEEKTKVALGGSID